LEAALVKRGAAEQKLAGLDEQYARAAALRDQDMMGRYNPATGFSGGGMAGTIAKGIQSIMAGNEARKLEPQRAAQRQILGETASALPMWQARRQAGADTRAEEEARLNAEKFEYQQKQDIARAKAAKDAAEREHIRGMERERLKQSSKGGLKPSSEAVKTYRGAVRMRGVLEELADMRKRMSETGLADLNEPKTQALLSVLPDAVMRLGEEATQGSEARQYFSRLSRLESELSKLASGLAVTGFEMKDRQKWSPNAPGISDAERQRRLDNLDKDLFSEISAFENLYGDRFRAGDYQKAYVSPGGAQNTPIPNGTKKVKGNTKYLKENGRWRPIEVKENGEWRAI
jgi:hypothetical protein